MAYRFLRIGVNKLIVNKDNPRFSSVEEEYDAIKAIILNQQEKLLNLIEDILENGLNPSELIIVVEDKSGYVVLEGNRRITALKLINDLDFYGDIDSKFSNKLSVILSKNSEKVINKVGAIVFDERLEANKWLKIRHTGENQGVGIVGWSRERKDKFIKETTAIKRVNKILDYVKQSEYYSSDLKFRLKDLKLNQLSKLLEDPHVRETIGLTLKNKNLYRIVSEEELSKGLKKILYDILDGTFKKGSISTKENRLSYIESFNKNQLPSYDEFIGEEKNLNSEELKEDAIVLNNEQITLEQLKEVALTIDESKKELIPKLEKKEINLNGIKKNKINRKYLIPSDVNIKIENREIEMIYKELKTLDIKRYANSVELLFRLFLEKITHNYIYKNKSLLEKKLQGTLTENLTEVLDYLLKEEKITLEEKTQLEDLLSSKKGLFKVEKFHDYSLNKEIFVDTMELKKAWDKLEFIIKILLA